MEEVVLPADRIATLVGIDKVCPHKATGASLSWYWVLFSAQPHFPGLQAHVLEMEIPLLEGLQFDLIVHQPFNPLNGFIIDLKVPHTGRRPPVF